MSTGLRREVIPVFPVCLGVVVGSHLFGCVRAVIGAGEGSFTFTRCICILVGFTLEHTHRGWGPTSTQFHSYAFGTGSVCVKFSRIIGRGFVLCFESQYLASCYISPPVKVEVPGPSFNCHGTFCVSMIGRLSRNYTLVLVAMYSVFISVYISRAESGYIEVVVRDSFEDKKES